MILNTYITRNIRAIFSLVFLPLALVTGLAVPSRAQSPPPPNLSILPPWATTVLDDSLQPQGGVYRVYYGARNQLAALAAHFDVWEVRPEANYAVIALDAENVARLMAQGYRLELDTGQGNIQPMGPVGYPCYRDVDELYTDLQQIVADYPGLAEMVDYGDSWLKEQDRSGYDLWVLKITNSQIETPKPRFILMSNIHARELTTPETAMYFIEHLLDNYDTDPDTTWIVDYHEVYVIVTVNPDGRQLVEQGCWQRKNRNDNLGDCTLCSDTKVANHYGVDLNRNYPYHWGEAGTNPCGTTYQGPLAASEPETYYFLDLVRSIIPDQRPDTDTSPAPDNTTGLLFSLHSYGNLVLWPWGWTFDKAPNGSQMQTLGRKFAYFNNYTPKQSNDLYTTTGGAADWTYGELGIPAYAFELGEAFFQDCDDLQQIMDENLGALLYAAKVPRTPYLTPSGPDGLEPTVMPITVTVSETAQLTATIDDTRYNISNGDEPTQTIAGAEYYIDTPPWITTTTPISYSMTAADSSFDEAIEVVTATIDTTDLSHGRHTLFVRGQDADGNWGAFSAAFLWVDRPITLTTITITPTLVTVTVGATQTFTATGYDQYDDPMLITPTWTTNGGTANPTSGVTTVLTAQTAPAGARLITATQGIISGTAVLYIVHGNATTVELTPTATTIAAGESQSYTSTARDAYSNTWDITALSTYTTTPDADGTWRNSVYTAETAGDWTVTVAYLGLTNTAVLTVTHAPTAVHLALSPAQHTVEAGEQVTCTLVATDAYGNSWDVTGNGRYTITSGAGGTWTDNVYTAEIAGTWAVTATSLGLTDTVTLTTAHASTAATATLNPTQHTVEADEQVTYTMVATDTYGNSWNATADGSYTITLAAGGSWTGNVYTSQNIGTWNVTGTISDTVAAAVLTVTQLPAASFTHIPIGAVCVNATVQFTDTSSGNLTAWAWDLGDGITTGIQYPTHTYTTTGAFTVTLTVTNVYGSDVAADTIKVVRGPSVGITRTPTEKVCLISNVIFSVTNSGGLADYVWSFGDGVTATGQYNSHVYVTAGTYTVWLTATNGCATDVISAVVTVDAGPLASFVRNPAGDVPVNTTVQFTDSSSGEPTAWLWRFGDGFTSTLQYPDHIYSSPGTFTVTLTITQACGSDAATSTVVVESDSIGAAIIALISDSTVAQGQTMHFTATTTGNTPITYTWDFGDGALLATGIDLITTSHVYTSSGVYTVYLTVRNCCGSDSTVLTVTVDAVAEFWSVYLPLVMRHHTSRLSSSLTLVACSIETAKQEVSVLTPSRPTADGRPSQTWQRPFPSRIK